MDSLAAEYGWPPAIIRRLPLAEVLCFHAAINDRLGADTGLPSFAELDLLRQVNPQN